MLGSLDLNGLLALVDVTVLVDLVLGSLLDGTLASSVGGDLAVLSESGIPGQALQIRR